MVVTLALPGGIQDSNFGTSNGVSDALVYYLPFCSHRSEFIARDIFRALLKGTDLIVPGTLNKLFVHGVCRYLPYAASASLAEFFWGPVPFSRRKYPALSADDMSSDLTDSFGYPLNSARSSKGILERWWRRLTEERTPLKRWWDTFSRIVTKRASPKRLGAENSTAEPNVDDPAIIDEILPDRDDLDPSPQLTSVTSNSATADL